MNTLIKNGVISRVMKFIIWLSLSSAYVNGRNRIFSLTSHLDTYICILIFLPKTKYVTGEDDANNFELIGVTNDKKGP